MLPSLSLLCVSKGEPFAARFRQEFYDLAQHLGAEAIWLTDGIHVHSLGYLESVLDEAITFTHGEYILRLDDDETVDHAMADWLATGLWMTDPIWKFPRRNLWKDAQHYLVTYPLWPDEQTRLTRRDLAGDRKPIHAGCPHGGGAVGVGAILHWSFLVKPYVRRVEISEKYDQIQEGAGTSPGMLPFTRPEDAFPTLTVRKVPV